MNKVKIICDSTCDISLDLLEKNDVEMIPLKVTIDGKEYKDLIELSSKDLFEKIENSESGELPKTSAISPMEFTNVFEKYINEGMDIVFISLDASISSTYSSACIAALDYPDRVFVVDTKNLSSAIGLIILEAIRLRNENKSASEMFNELNQIVPKVQCSFVLNTMEYLHKGGRCTALNYYFGRIFHLHPIIKMIDGKLNVNHVPRGHINKGLDIIIDEFLEEYKANKVRVGTVMITHACTEQSVQYIYDKLIEYVPKENIMITCAGCVISSHCGPKCIGILYINK